MIDKKTAEKFLRYMSNYSQLYKELAMLVSNNIPKKTREPVIVDLGVGPGLLSKEINKILPKAKIYGMDPSDEMLKIAKQNANIQTLKSFSERIPLDDESVDLLVTRFTLTYWQNPKKSFTEISRVLKPHGKIIIEALNKDFSNWNLFLIKTHMILKGSGVGVARYHADAYKTAYNITSVKKFLENTGFYITSIQGNKKDWKFIVIAEK